MPSPACRDSTTRTVVPHMLTRGNGDVVHHVHVPNPCHHQVGEVDHVTRIVSGLGECRGIVTTP